MAQNLLTNYSRNVSRWNSQSLNVALENALRVAYEFSTLRSRRNNLSREVRFAFRLRSPCNESFGLPDYAVTLSSYPKYEAKSIPFPTRWFVHLHPLFVCDARSRDSLLHRNLDSIAFSRVCTHANIIHIYFRGIACRSSWSGV